ncbi:substrate-binding domain-containing protein [Paraburkholderia fungorum]|uniref:substrate-binding domain-containing protein n=1 Tax=Paraburkholderia fungorum TaxID=134537 RepID=UPI0038B878C8
MRGEGGEGGDLRAGRTSGKSEGSKGGARGHTLVLNLAEPAAVERALAELDLAIDAANGPGGALTSAADNAARISTGDASANAAGNTTANAAGNATANAAGNTTANAAGNTTANAAGNTTANAAGNTTADAAGNTTADAAGNTTANAASNPTGKPSRIALFAANAPVALCLALHLKARYGADWQTRVALLSIDDPEWAELTGVTTIRQPTYEIGYRAVEFLHERIEGIQTTARDCLLPGELIVRASTLR